MRAGRGGFAGVLLLEFAFTRACLGPAVVGICTHGRQVAQWSPGGPRRPPIVICAQSAVRVGNGAVHVRDGAAIVFHRQRVDGAAVPICSQGMVP